MAKKATPDSAEHNGFNDVVGIVLLGCAILLLIALLSYDPHDSPANYLPVNNPIHNWIGPVGAWLADKWLKGVGISAYAMPFMLMFVGLGCFFRALSYV